MDRKGFTLIELIVVLAILAILAAIALPNYMAIKCRACEAEAKESLGEMRKLAWGAYIETNAFPSYADLTGKWGFMPPGGGAYTYGGTGGAVGGSYTADANNGVGCLTGCTTAKDWVMAVANDGTANLT
jgi:prepilin-type N-terminal cleavage/methylation domain-containing protein